MRSRTSAASSSPATTRPTASICRPTIAAISSPGASREGRVRSGYWTSFYHWYDHGGYEIVAYYLAEHDLTEFNPKAPPPQTEAFWEIVEAGRAAESTELMTVLELLQMPEAITVEMLKEATNDSELQEWLKSRHNRKAIAHQLEECGYVRVRNPGDKQGMWKIHGKKMVIYARINLSVKDRIAAAQRLR